MITLGINAAFHDSAAALVVDGEVVAAAEEERFTRIKHGKRPVAVHGLGAAVPRDRLLPRARPASRSPRSTTSPTASIRDDFDGAAAADDAATIALPLLPGRSRARRRRVAKPVGSALPRLHPRTRREQLVDGAPHHLARRFAGVDARRPPYRWHFVDHHLAHQASAFLAAPFERCAVMTLDGRGERATTTYGACSASGGALAYRSLGEVEMPHSLGLLYEQITDASRLPALERRVQGDGARRARHADADGGAARPRPRRRRRPVRGRRRSTPKRCSARARRRGAPLEQRHFDLAASLQDVLEDTVLALAALAARGERRAAPGDGRRRRAQLRDERAPARQRHLRRGLGAARRRRRRHRARRGAVGRSAARDGDEHVAARDRSRRRRRRRRRASVALAPRRWRMAHAYLGPGFDDAEIERALAWAKLPYRRCGDDAELVEAVAALLADGPDHRLVPGPHGVRPARARRALDPRLADRPGDAGAPQRAQGPRGLPPGRAGDPARGPGGLVRAGRLPTAAASPFMLFVYDVRAGQAARIPSACHTDRHRARADGRRRDQSALPRPAARVRARAPACRCSSTPRSTCAASRSSARRGDAIEAFFSTPLDALVIGRFIVEKARMSSLTRRRAPRSTRSSARAASPMPAYGAGGVRVSVVIPTFRRPGAHRPLSRGRWSRSASTPARSRSSSSTTAARDDTQAAVDGVARAHPAHAIRYLRPHGGHGPAAARNAGWRARARRAHRLHRRRHRARSGLARRRRARPRCPTSSPSRPRRRAAAGSAGRRRGAAPTDHELMTRGLERAEFVTANAFVRRSALIAGRRLRRALQARLARGLGPAVRAARRSGRIVRCADARSSSTRCAPKRGA